MNIEEELTQCAGVFFLTFFFSWSFFFSIRKSIKLTNWLYAFV